MTAPPATIYGVGASKENPDIKFLQLRKTRVSPETPVDVSNGIAVSNEHNLVFAVSSESRVEVIPASNLFNYEWSKNIINQVSDASPITAFNSRSRVCFLSVSLKGSVFVSCGVNQGQSLELSFFDVSVIASTRTAVPFAAVGFSGSGVTSLEWHPELTESLLILTTKDGKAVSVSINSNDRSGNILAELVTPSRLTFASWSPKGKQVAFSKNNGCITFYKHANGTNFTEARIILPPPDLVNYSCWSIKWVLSSILWVAYVKNDPTDPDTRYCLLSAAVKATPEVMDYGRICFDFAEITDLSSYSISFLHVRNNLVLSSCSHANEIAVVGHDALDDKKASIPSSWTQYVLDDDKRIELPLTSTSVETFPRGVAFLRQTTQEMKVTDTLRYGGPNTPCLMILNTEGVICSYYLITGPDSVGNAPQVGKTAQTHSSPQQTNQVRQQQIVPQTPAKPSQADFVESTLGSLTFCPPSHSTPQVRPANPFSFKGAQVSLPPSTFGVTSSSTSVTASSKPQTLAASSSSLIKSSPLSQLTGIGAAISAAGDKKNAAPRMLPSSPTETKVAAVKDVVLEAVKEEMVNIQKMIQEHKVKMFSWRDKFRSLMNFQSLSVYDDAWNGQSGRAIEQEAKAIASDLAEFKEDNDAVTGGLLLDQAAVVEAKSRLEKLQDEKRSQLQLKCSLDPITQRKLNNVLESQKFLEQRLEAVTHCLAMKWERFLESQNRLPGATSRREKQLQDLETIRKTIERQGSSLHFLSQEVSNLQDILVVGNRSSSGYS